MIPENAFLNGAGQIGVKWMPNRPARTVQISGTDRYYVAEYKYNVPFYWIDEQDLEKVLAVKEKTCNCNNGTYINAFQLINQIDFNLYTCGDRNCP